MPPDRDSSEEPVERPSIDVFKGARTDVEVPEAGNFGRHPGTNEWLAAAPNGAVVGLSRHEVIEHEDGTISASPAISAGDWAGWLTRGVWRTTE